MEYIYEMPAEMLTDTPYRGEVRRFEYDTRTYDEGEDHPLHKGAWVYLPYGYDASKQYNTLYLLHGASVNEDWWFKMFPDTVKILDNMMEKKICEPCIIVTPTYYRGEGRDREAEYMAERSDSCCGIGVLDLCRGGCLGGKFGEDSCASRICRTFSWLHDHIPGGDVS